MNIRLLGIGKTNDKNIQQLLNDYEQRLKHYANVKLEFLELRKKFPGIEKQKEEEGKLLLSKVHKGSRLIILDELGKQFSSEGFAAYLQKQLQTPGKEIVFVLGGAYGFSQEVYERADAKMGLSKMTFTHQMVRLIFLEQLYRAFTILKGEKYHH
jgi:23S rRNA (pseudouridine1915-N3)-methyltransferase